MPGFEPWLHWWLVIALTKLYHPCRSLINTCVKQTTLLVFFGSRHEVWEASIWLYIRGLKVPFFKLLQGKKLLTSEWMAYTYTSVLFESKKSSELNLEPQGTGEWFHCKVLKILMLFLRATNLNLWWCKLWIIVVSILLQKQFVLCPFLACERQRSTYCSNISSFHCCILSQTTPNNQSECRKPFSSFDQS